MSQSEILVLGHEANCHARTAYWRTCARVTVWLRAPIKLSLLRTHRRVLIAWLLIVAIGCQPLVSIAAASNPRPLKSKSEAHTRTSTTRKSKAKGNSPTAQNTETFTVYGPRRFDRTGLVTRFAEQFSLPEGAIAPFNVQIQNGAADGTGRVLFGTIRLNGSPLLEANDLNLSVPSITRPVTLTANNRLEVQFFGRSSSFLTVTFTATRNTQTPAPVITDFNPKRGPVGTGVTLTGTALTAATGATTVTFAGSGNTRLPALVSSASATQVRATVPGGAVTGTIELTTVNGRATTNGVFTVESPQDFQLNIAPSTATTVQRGTAIYVVSVSSQQPTFTQLARLSATGLPAGVLITFEPQQITAGATSTLSVNLNNVDLSPGSYSFTVSAAADVDGRVLTRTAAATLNVQPAGQTTLSGRVLSTLNEPIIGATASLDGRTATTDAAGAFLLLGVTAGMHRAVMVDGRTASAPGRTYPVINEEANIIANQINVIPYNFYLPPIDVQYEVPVMPNQETVATNPRLPDYKLTVPVGARLRNRDNSPVARMSVTPLPIDRIPAPLPPGVMTAEVWTAQPGGALSDIPIPVTYPNDMHADPGTRCDLYVFDHDNVRWTIYGTGRVSADGRTVVPEINPANGRQYGLSSFAWHYVAPPPNTSNNPSPHDSCPTNTTGNPVNLSTGLKLETTTDISFSGARGGLEITRTHTTGLAVNNFVGRFGRGTKDNYDIRLTGTFQANSAGRFVLPEEGTGRLFSYARTDTDGALVFTSVETVGQLGDVLRKLPNGAFEYRYADGRRLRFDSNRRLVALVDTNDNTTTLTYTGANPTRITDSVGRALSLDYDTANRITRATDPIGRIWRYAYDSGGRLSSVTDPLLNATQYTYDNFGRLLSITDPRGILVKQLTYDVNGRVSEQKFADNGIERYSYALSGMVVTSATVTDPFGRVTSKRFNAAGYVNGETDALGQSSVIERDMMTNLPVSTTGPCGCPEVTREFDSRGNATRITDRLGQITRYEYEPVFNKVSAMSDPLGRVTTYGYDPRGNLILVSDALHQITRYTYDANGLLTSVADPLGHISRTEYDVNGNVTARVDALGNRTTMEYDVLGRLTATIDPLNRRTSMAYDALGRITSVTDPAGAITRFTYDANGNQVSLTNALGRQWTSIYDLKNRLLSATDPIGRMTRYRYNSDDELIAVTSPSGRVTRYTYDPRGQRATVTDPLNGVVRYAYDNRGNLATLTDQRGNTTTFTYDELFRPKDRRDPVGKTSSVGYDAAGNVTERTDRLGRRTTISYDALNRPTRIAYADAVVTYTYDAAGRRTRVDDTQSGGIAWNYDDANRLLSETTPVGTVSYAYNEASQRLSMTVTDRPPVTYGYDPAGRLQTITQGPETFTYSYDALSRMRDLRRPNSVTTTYSYDAVNRLERLTHTSGQNQPIEDYRYSYNADDEIASITSLASAQLLPTAKTVSPADAANRIAQFGQSSFSFDDEGQTTVKTVVQGTTSYEWDARGRLTRATLPSSLTISYTYDALGRRSSRTVGGVPVRFLYDADDVVLDEGSNDSTVDYLNGLEVDQKLRQTSAQTGRLYSLLNNLSSTAELTDAAGNVIEQMQYEAFGESGSGAPSKYSFTGREWDQDTDLYYYRARYYNPKAGRFITEDPINFAGGINFYAYVNDNPITQTDPSGLKAHVCCRPLDIPISYHCFIVTDDGTTYSLIPRGGIFSKNSIGIKLRNYDKDRYAKDKICQSCESSNDCQNNANKCLQNAYTNYPIGGYSPFGPNSNTFAATLAGKCCKGGWPSGLPKPPGINSPPPY